MTIKETTNFLERIKQHYQEFIIDEFKIDEWHNVLKDYELKDVNNKLDEHLRSEEFGNHIPKVFFLTKYLTTIEEKQNTPQHKIYCQICNQKVLFSEYDEHFKRCSSIRYLNSQYEKYFNKKLDVEMLKKMSSNDFDENYRKVLNYIKENTENQDEKERVKCVLENTPFKTFEMTQF